MSNDDWNVPTPPVKSVTTVAPGMKLTPGPIQPLPTERVELILVDPDEIAAMDELRLQNKKLRAENNMLMKQIEDAWEIIKTRDQQLTAMMEGQ
jgi:hypothetical protein